MLIFKLYTFAEIIFAFKFGYKLLNNSHKSDVCMYVWMDGWMD